MTIDQALHTVDELCPNQIERARKIAWLDTIDRQIFRDVIARHERNAEDAEIPAAFAGYDQDTDADTELLAKAPYDEIYRFYLETQINFANREIEAYNESAALYGAAWGNFAREYHRTHKSRQPAIHHDFGDARRDWRNPLKR